MRGGEHQPSWVQHKEVPSIHRPQLRKETSRNEEHQSLVLCPYVLGLFFFTSLFNLCLVIFGLTPFGWLIWIYLSPFFLYENYA